MRQQDKTRARPRPRQPSQAFASRSIDPKTETFKDVFKVKRKHGTSYRDFLQTITVRTGGLTRIIWYTGQQHFYQLQIEMDKNRELQEGLVSTQTTLQVQLLDRPARTDSERTFYAGAAHSKSEDPKALEHANLANGSGTFTKTAPTRTEYRQSSLQVPTLRHLKVPSTKSWDAQECSFHRTASSNQMDVAPKRCITVCQEGPINQNRDMIQDAAYQAIAWSWSSAL
ncbi:hypothetical protein B0O80DRAFT_501525 [Mortierella sp. GBAus27b]|nr:hypothetical protein B0O80DRAFT_501525 [Mortierella sp. GBAus27b]